MGGNEAETLAFFCSALFIKDKLKFKKISFTDSERSVLVK